MALHLLSDGTTFAYSNVETPTICYLHGWGRDSQDFRVIMEKFPGIAIDLPGFGKTKSFEQSLNPSEYAAYLNKILPSEITSIVAHSFGGRVAVHLSLIKSLENLVLIGVPLIMSNSRSSSINKLSLIKKLNKYGLLSSKFVESTKNKLGSLDYRNSEGVMRETLVKAVNDDLYEKLKLVDTNVHLIWGEDDIDVPLSVAHEANEVFTQSELTIIPNQGHNVLMNDPDAIFEVLNKL